ncbi:MAG: Uma2 family endonuclease [Candidatus Schekmanbacteria bacterium]|nr:Uma2 family endonuclease [Candidatus Schekmanbacteria bacterium]
MNRTTTLNGPSVQHTSSAEDQAIPPLENGDRLTRPDFERRYEAMPHVKKAELIEGAVYMPSLVRMLQHARPHSWIIIWLGAYYVTTPGVDLGDNPSDRLDLDNEPQPDALLRIARGGSSRIGEDGFLEGPPELIVEVASSTVSIDLHDKKDVYRRNGVQEYLVWAVAQEALFWFVLREGRYDPLAPDGHGVVRSEVFPGLWLATRPLLNGDLPAVLQCVRQGTASQEHAAFVRRLAGADAGT